MCLRIPLIFIVALALLLYALPSAQGAPASYHVSTSVSGPPERKIVLPGDDPVPTQIYTASSSHYAIGDDSEEAEEDNVETKCGWDVGNAEIVETNCTGEGCSGNCYVKIRWAEGDEANTIVTHTFEASSNQGDGSATDSLEVVVPEWKPDLPITPGEIPEGVGEAGASVLPEAGNSTAGETAGEHAITSPSDQLLVIPESVLALAGIAHDPDDKRIGAETTTTPPAPIQPLWHPPAQGTLTGGTENETGCRSGSGVVWTAPASAGGTDEYRLILPEAVGMANLPISADFIDTVEHALPGEKGTSIDPPYTDTVNVHLLDAVLATDVPATPLDPPRNVMFSWLVGPALAGLGGQGTVYISDADVDGETLPETLPFGIAEFTVSNGAASAWQANWDPTGWPTGVYTFTLTWNAEFNGQTVPVQSSSKVILFKVSIAEEDGTLPPRPVICVRRTATYKAVVEPEGLEGDYEWGVVGTTRIGIPGATDLETVEVRGEVASAELEDAPLKLVFTPAGCNSASNLHGITVADVEIRSYTGGKPPTVICIGGLTRYRVKPKPEALVGAFQWGVETQQARLGIEGLEDENKVAFCRAGAQHSPDLYDETLSVTFLPAGVPEEEGVEDAVYITIADVIIRAICGNPPMSSFIGAGQGMDFTAASLPSGINGNHTWSTDSMNLALVPAGENVEVTAAQEPTSTDPQQFKVVFSPTDAETTCSDTQEQTIVVVDLDDERDNDNRPRVAPANRSDRDRDGIPDYADGYNLDSLGGHYKASNSQFIVVTIDVRGIPDLSRVEFSFSYPISLPSNVSRSGQSCPLVYRAKSDQKISDPSFRFYSYPVNGGAMRLWLTDGVGERKVSSDLLLKGVWYKASLFESKSPTRVVVYVEGISAVDSASLICKMKYGDDSSSCVAMTEDEAKVSVAELDVNVNSDNDRNVGLNIADDAVEDQGNGFLFWPSRNTRSSVSARGIVDLMPIQFSLPQAFKNAGYNAYLEIHGPENARVDFYRNSDQSNPVGYLTNPTTGEKQLGESREVVLDGLKFFPMSQSSENWLIKFRRRGVHTIYFGMFRIGCDEWLIGDSVRVTVRDPSEFYWYGSARGDQNTNFSYPLDENAFVNIQRFPDVARLGDDNRDWTKQKHFVFLHGFNNNKREARAWSNEMIKRLYWTGYRDNFIGITWFGDFGIDLTPWSSIPNVEEICFDRDVKNALHTSPSVYLFLRNKVINAWGVSPENINIMGHSLGNLVVWDTLRINAHLNAGTRLVNNVINSEAAMWPECFAKKVPLIYSGADDDPKTYTPAELIKHSWSFWCRQPGHEAIDSASRIYHSHVDDDSSLFWMRVNDKTKRGTILPGGRQHYYRDRVNGFPNNRTPETLHHTPTLMLSNHRNLNLCNDYDTEDINKPLGAGVQDNSVLNLVQVAPVTKGLGWRSGKHSDLRNQPFYLIFPWYEDFLKKGIQVP